ncbi:hypothetical protein HBI56_095890 [Parastagonospora nodorum]|uniref:G-protein coupled receptors family 2 profile 2 domain-containing protein n=2 Tax=Phaeosphaeria nodorum (strain SN15 / ATCC MYA-4574 / FGSC 10173) TaxID=321614 RepID=A0A7U2F4J0_PHANO|nr:hypothetical protein SNOG_04365 [Parastagonospora nodorum SN15]KAH3914586.1 hypothetical protein HBH56_091280 [Parastagonospora nodorum]EAT88125.1 hypothetical protein SNOG_04365 [Parastagonospora nodorum SN15]KAH3936407.1 hypothetical protein HBH54_025920 [Parastagonospora nodorum]KAH3940477.1 hypothetical protein HBH53_215990 [Parastagonospora nodorum]KAH3957665.1 hypothetical protein HBH51_220790 [Parastagonospora nodorum]
MSNGTQSSPLHGACPAPFYDASKFDLGGFVDGRFCAPVGRGLVCCLPCPMTDYLYPQDFNTYYTVAEGLNVAGLVLLVFLLVSFLVLPAEKTRRHYLSYCLIIAAIFMALGFVIPLGAEPEQCYNEITPNDMYSSLPCALSGAFLISGGLSMAVWIFIRALSMHLQICWDVTPGRKFFYWAQGLGWSVAATFFTITITITGVSFRFGDVCHVNPAHSMSDFWGPLLAIAGAAMLIQVATFGYCIKVYLQNMLSDDKTETQSSAGLPSYTTSMRTRSARAVYRRVRKVLWLQWRGITIVVFILVDVIFFSVVFIWLNALTTHARDNVQEMMPFLTCLMANPTDPSPCFELGQDLAVNESTVIAILMMLSIAGIQVFVLLARGSMFSGWLDFFRGKFSKNREFVSLDARNLAEHSRNYELKKFEDGAIQSPANVLTHPPEIAGYGQFRSDTPDYFTKETQREYVSPTLSFSTPRPMSRSATQVDWDPRSTHARGGLGFHPPEYDAKI